MSDGDLEAIIAAGGRRGAIHAGLKRIRDTYAGAIRDGLPEEIEQQLGGEASAAPAQDAA